MKNNRDEIMDEYFKLISNAAPYDDEAVHSDADYVNTDLSDTDMLQLDILHDNTNSELQQRQRQYIKDRSDWVNMYGETAYHDQGESNWSPDEGTVELDIDDFDIENDDQDTKPLLPPISKRDVPLDVVTDDEYADTDKDIQVPQPDADPNVDVEPADPGESLGDEEIAEMIKVMPDLLITELKIYREKKYEKFSKQLIYSIVDWFSKNKDSVTSEKAESIIEAIGYMIFQNKDISDSLSGNERRMAQAFSGKLRKHIKQNK